MRAAALLGASLLLAASCGGYSEDGADSASEKRIGTETGEADGWTSYGLANLVPSGPKPRPAEVYSVFKRPATPADGRTAAISDLMQLDDHATHRGDPADLGRVQIDSARIVLADLDGNSTTLIAAPTTTRAVCFMLAPEGGGSCGFPNPDDRLGGRARGRTLARLREDRRWCRGDRHRGFR
jgi:hypothetical protein